MAEITKLVSLLPHANYACLRALLSHLLGVIQKSEINKMTVRNISIVFSPTLGVPAGLFILLLAEFSSIFIWGLKESSRSSSELESTAVQVKASHSSKEEAKQRTALPEDNYSDSPIVASISNSTANSIQNDVNKAAVIDTIESKPAHSVAKKLPPLNTLDFHSKDSIGSVYFFFNI